MKLKILCIALGLLVSGSLLTAQSTTDANTSFAVLGGVNFQNLNGQDFMGDKLTNEMIIGYHAGVNAQIPIAPEFYFQPGLLFSTKGAKNVSSLGTTTYNLSYIEMPLNLTYKALLGNGSFMLGFGPYVGYGISGKVTSEIGSLKVERDVEFKNTIESAEPLTAGPYFKRFDGGGNIFTGYELLSGIFAQANVQLGMLKINPEDNRIATDKTSIKNTGFGLSIGYRF